MHCKVYIKRNSNPLEILLRQAEFMPPLLHSEHACGNMLSNTFELASVLLNIFHVVLCRQPSVSDVQINKNLSKGPHTQHGAEGSGERSSPLYFRQHVPMNILAVPSAPLAPCWTRSQYVLLMIQWICLQSSRGTHTGQTQPRCQNTLPRPVL